MRSITAAVACAVLFAGSFSAAPADEGTAFDQDGFHVTLPSGWTEIPSLEKVSVDGFKQGDPSDPIQAFAWGNPQKTAYLLVQVTSTTGQIDAGRFRTSLTAMNHAVEQSMGLSSTDKSSVTDDGTVMTGNIEGNMGNMHVLMNNEGLVDAGRHLHAFSIMCMMRAPASSQDLSQCSSLESSFKITLDRAMFLPLEPQ